jgi:microsomal dipeptidase-like Zn-dependent dipeptidase
MNQFNRKNFLRKIMLAGLGSAMLPKLLRGHSLELPAQPLVILANPDLGHYYPNEFAIIDLHCHPSLKMYLFGRKLWRRHTPGLGINAIDLQDDMKQLTSGSIRDQDGEGFVKGIIAAHYLPERGIDQWDMLKNIFPRLARVFKHFAGKIEDGNASNFAQLMDMIRELNIQKDIANKKKGRELFVIAKNFRDFNQAMANCQFPIAHAIEGAHAIGRNMQGPADDASKYIDNLIVLKNNGVCMMTLAHFFANDVASCVEGISPDEKKSIGMQWSYTNNPIDNRRLTRVGEKVVDWMLDNGMIIDLTHSTPAIRDQVFRMNFEKPVQRPIVFTHTGAQEIFTKYDDNKYPNFAYYGVSPEEILKICGCNGTIGVIPEVFWLAGGDTHLRCQGLPPKLFRNGIPYMIETIQYINSMTPAKDYGNVSIGTDFDGFADSPQDLYEATQLDGLIEALRYALTRELGDPHTADEAVKRITSGNAYRVLQNGWI